MANLNGFDARQVDPAADFEPIPAGKYLAVITESELKPTKNGGGQYLQLAFQILDGPYKNRYVWARLNLTNANPTTVQIARAELSAICRAIGVLTPKDSVELHNLPLAIRVSQKKRADTGELTNVIKGYEKKEALAGEPQQQATSNQGAYNGSTPPWRRS
ncbi:MAG: DUF669 domain-containing protein [Anaerolineae bacterium]|nr:DUF669 domain-containing protein [Anaerolineae bacterium]